jgi:branched-chain amino acid transport system substrate-binding protein
MPGIRSSGRRPDRLHRHGLLLEDGRTVHSMFPLQVRKPEESKAPWDYHKVLAEVPGKPGVPAQDGGCLAIK